MHHLLGNDAKKNSEYGLLASAVHAALEKNRLLIPQAAKEVEKITGNSVQEKPQTSSVKINAFLRNMANSEKLQTLFALLNNMPLQDKDEALSSSYASSTSSTYA